MISETADDWNDIPCHPPEADYLLNVEIPKLSFLRPWEFYRSLKVDENLTIYSGLEFDCGPDSFMIWMHEDQSELCGSEMTQIFPTAADAFYYFLAVVVPLICIYGSAGEFEDWENRPIAISSDWKALAASAIRASSDANDAEAGLVVVNKKLTEYYASASERDVRIFPTISVQQYLEHCYKDYEPEDLEDSLKKVDGKWTVTDWSELLEMTLDGYSPNE